MADAYPYAYFNSPSGGAEPDALLGFSLPFLPDMLTSRWISGSSEQERLEQALRLQQRLVSAFWNSSITAWDLRFVGTEEFPGLAIGLLCRVRRPPQIDTRKFLDYCLACARQVQLLFADFGYELLALVDEASLARYLSPFAFQALAEIRRQEELLIIEDAYNEYEIYVPYPWHWALQTRLRLFEALLNRQSNCLVSIYLEPTHLSPSEQTHLNHATSLQVRDLLWSSGPRGETTYSIYQDYVRTLRQPYMLRISLTASSPQTVQQVGRIFQDELAASQPLGTMQRAFLHDFSWNQASGTGPILVFPQNQQEWHVACRSMYDLKWLPWGQNHGMALSGTARLRYLVDDVAASMAFRLPVARSGDVPGVPVSSLPPSTGSPPAAKTAGHNLSTAPTLPATSMGSQSNNLMQKASQPAPTAPPDVIDLHKPEDLIGIILGSCQIDAFIGQGGFGAVYRALQPHLNRQVAVKVVLPAISNEDPRRRRKMALRFDHEAQAIARLDHPNILSLYEYQPGPLPYIVMPYIAGGSLAGEIKYSGHRPMPASGVAIILKQLASALDHAHSQRLVHRDIKPDNLLRHPDGRILLSDFGIVQFEDDELTALTTDKQSRPYTPAYASPEQHQGFTIDSSSDIYSLGVVVYELLCRHRPFKTPYEHVFSSPPPMLTFGVQVHPKVEAVVVKAMAKQPEQRYQSAGQMASEFQAAMESS